MKRREPARPSARAISGSAHAAANRGEPAEVALRESEVRYRRLFETARDGILILDAETGRITEVNPFLCELLGYSRAELLGKELWEIGVFEDAAASRAAFEHLQQTGYDRHEDLPLKTHDKGQVEVEFVSNVYLAGEKSVIPPGRRAGCAAGASGGQPAQQCRQVHRRRRTDLADGPTVRRRSASSASRIPAWASSVACCRAFSTFSLRRRNRSTVRKVAWASAWHWCGVSWRCTEEE